MKKKLGINLSAFPNCYSTDADVNTILQNNELVDKTIAVINSLKYSSNMNFQNLLSEMFCDCENETYKFCANVYSENVKGLIYAKVSCKIDNIEFSFHVSKHVKWHSWSSIGIFLSRDLDLKKNISVWDNTNKLFVCCKKGLIFKNDKIEKEFFNEKINLNDYWLKVKYDRNKIIWSYSIDGNDWKILYTESVYITEDIYLGIILDFGYCMYYDWLFYHYIGISYSVPLMESIDGTPTDFLAILQKNYDPFLVHPFLKYYRCPKFIMKKIDKENFINLVKNSINNNMYIQTMLDEFYISQKGSYNQAHYIHSNLIYGYDNNSKTFMLLGYNKKGKYQSIDVSFDEIYNAFCFGNYVANFISIEYPYTTFKIQVDDILKHLRNYINSVDISILYDFLVGKRVRQYGFSHYKQLLEKNNFAFFLYDKRIAHFIYEHKKILCSLIDFVFYRHIISSEKYNDLKKIFYKLEKDSVVLRNLVIKQQIKKQMEIENNDNIFNKLKKLEHDEEKAIKKLISVLEQI